MVDRRVYQHEYYVKHKQAQHKARVTKAHDSLGSLKGSYASRKLLVSFEHSPRFKELQNYSSYGHEWFAGGSGYNEPLKQPRPLKIAADKLMRKTRVREKHAVKAVMKLVKEQRAVDGLICWFEAQCRKNVENTIVPEARVASK